MSRGRVSFLFAALFLIASRERSFVSTAAIGPSDYNTDGVRSGLTNRVIDEDVRDLQSLKPSFPEGVQSVGIHKSESAIFTDMNGQKESHIENKEEVNSNGEKIGSFHLLADSKDVANSPTSSTHIRSELDIPQRGVHSVYDTSSNSNNNNNNNNNNNVPPKRRVLVPRTDIDENNVDGYRSYSGVQYSPFDMAEYVFWTGDEKGVTLAIEEFLQDGLMTREEAIAFLQEIKMNLDYLQTHYAEERLQKQEQAKERVKQLQKALSSMDKFTENKMGGQSELAEVRQQMRENLSKKAVDTDDTVSALSRARVSQSAIQQSNLGLTDEDYEDLLERLRVADFLYTEYSLEEVIYQLAKVMFSQSLTRGSNEAQEALQKFTGFLEAEAEQGRISRSLEKKVLDVLIASLTDTLTEHPELVGAARAGLGGDQMGLTRTGHGDRALQQLLLLNQGPTQSQTKTGLELGNNIMKSHRFQGGESAIASESGSAMKKSSQPANQLQHANP